MTAAPTTRRTATLTSEEATRVDRIDHLVASGLDATDELVVMLTDRSWAVRRAVVSALAALGAAAVPALCRARVGARDDEARIAAAVDALVASIGAGVDDAVAGLAGDANPAVVADVAQILGRRRTSNAVPLLVELTRHANDNVAVGAIEALGRVGGRAAVESLVETVRGGNFFRSFPAIDVLGRSGDPRAVAVVSQDVV